MTPLDKEVAEWMEGLGFTNDDRYEDWEGFKGLWRHKQHGEYIVLHGTATFFYTAFKAQLNQTKLEKGYKDE